MAPWPSDEGPGRVGADRGVDGAGLTISEDEHVGGDQ